MKKFFSMLTFLMFSVASFGQQAGSEVEMADSMRQDGKIYVVVGIILIVLAGLIVYLFMMDRKITRLEKRVDSTP